MRRSRTIWFAVALAVSIGLGVLATSLSFAPRGAIQRMAWSCALLSLFWSLLTPALDWPRLPIAAAQRGPLGEVVWVDHCVALLFGVVAACIQSVVLTMRCVFVVIDILRGYPWQRTRDFGFDSAGLWPLGALAAACAVGLFATRDKRLVACQFWTLMMFAGWSCLLAVPYRATATGGYERTDAILLLTGVASGVLLASVILVGWLGDSGFFDRHGVSTPAIREVIAMPPGFGASVLAVAMVLILATCFHLLVPIGFAFGGIRISAAVACGSAAVSALACFILLRREWADLLADAAMGLTSVAFCGAALLFLPAVQGPLADRYPMMFCAMVVGAAAASAVWTNLVCGWEGLVPIRVSSEMRTRLVPHAKRFAFLSGAIALLAATSMNLWPRLPGIAVMDHSLGRVAAGFGAHLFLLLVTLSASRRLGRGLFQLLTVLSAVSTAGFLFVRMLPFASDLG